MKESFKETIIPMIIIMIYGVCFGMYIKQKDIEYYKQELEERNNIQIQTNCKDTVGK